MGKKGYGHNGEITQSSFGLKWVKRAWENYPKQPWAEMGKKGRGNLPKVALS